MDVITTECQDAQFNLEMNASSTVEFVNSLTFLEVIQNRIEELDQQAVIVNKMYQLIEQYKIAVAPEDLAIYKVILLLFKKSVFVDPYIALIRILFTIFL